jgi:hypothetical protein
MVLFSLSMMMMMMMMMLWLLGLLWSEKDAIVADEFPIRTSQDEKRDADEGEHRCDPDQ